MSKYESNHHESFFEEISGLDFHVVRQKIDAMIQSLMKRYKIYHYDDDDVRNELWIDVINKIHNFDKDRGEWYTFVKVIINGKMKTLLSQSFTPKYMPHDSLPGENLLPVYHYHNHMPLEEKEIYEYVTSRLPDILSEFEFEVCELQYEGYKYGEIANMLNTNVKAVDNAISRIRDKLKKLRQEELE